MVAQAIAPDYALSSHVAALGLAFSMDSALPEPYANGAFIGEHGSWNRNTFNGYKVVYVPFDKNGAPVGKAQDVVTGFIDGDQARGRPVGVAIDGTGALLIADDAGNTVWRVAGADGKVTSQPIGTDRVASNATPSTAPSTGTTSATGSPAPPSQTNIAPAVLPEAPWKTVLHRRTNKSRALLRQMMKGKATAVFNSVNGGVEH